MMSLPNYEAHTKIFHVHLQSLIAVRAYLWMISIPPYKNLNKICWK